MIRALSPRISRLSSAAWCAQTLADGARVRVVRLPSDGRERAVRLAAEALFPAGRRTAKSGSDKRQSGRVLMLPMLSRAAAVR